MFGVIYKITDHTNGKIYVGKTTRTIENRFNDHKYAPSLIGDAIREHKPENFTIEVIKECQTREELNEQELAFINGLNSWEPNGYNCKSNSHRIIQQPPPRRLTDIFDRPDLKPTKTFSFAQLRYFVATAKEKNFTRAAAKLFLTQPALSRQIKSLEKICGIKLFVRGRSSCTLTDNGLEFLHDAEKLLSLVDELEKEFKPDGKIRGEIYIGCAESDAMKFVARAVKNVRENYPDVCFNLYSGNVEDIEFRLDKGLLDFYVTLQNVDVSKYDSLTLPAVDVWGIILRRDDPLAEKKFFTVADLQTLPLILSREALREEYPKLFGTSLEKFRVVATYNLLYNAAILARENVGYPVSLDKLIYDAELCFRPIEPEFTSPLKFVWRKNFPLTPQAQVLLDEMKKLYP